VPCFFLTHSVVVWFHIVASSLSLYVCVHVGVSVMSQPMSQSLKPSLNNAETYDARHCVLCWVYGDGDDDVSLSAFSFCINVAYHHLVSSCEVHFVLEKGSLYFQLLLEQTVSDYSNF